MPVRLPPRRPAGHGHPVAIRATEVRARSPLGGGW
ncbi:DUF3373 domain-containing protein [Solirubrobacter taibaiensis]|nr:DUF3373 domain-containing protein [Solirubrobacter taibaiensis]